MASPRCGTRVRAHGVSGGDGVWLESMRLPRAWECRAGPAYGWGLLQEEPKGGGCWLAFPTICGTNPWRNSSTICGTDPWRSLHMWEPHCLCLQTKHTHSQGRVGSGHFETPVFGCVLCVCVGHWACGPSSRYNRVEKVATLSAACV
eukprot:365477-Chlamydomonas_euryale.AAC.2